MTQRIGFIGVGIMGEGMASCLLKAKRSLVVWNRDASKAQKLAEAYPGLVTVVKSPGDVIAKCALTYSMLSTLEASEAVFPQIIDSIRDGKSLVDCATLTPERMQLMNDDVIANGGRFLEAPVSGSKVPAQQGALIFLCGGDRDLYDQVKPDLSEMGKADFHYGDVGAGSKMKLVVNMVMGSMMVALGEGLALCEASQLPADDGAGLLKVLDLGIMANGLFKLKGPKMLKGDHAPNFPLKHAQKDMRFALNLGDRASVPLPLAAAANAAFLAQRAAHGDADFSAVYEGQKK
jgi:3-hydroxyisobutyrate dehydrogenase-like beta-hydroxyacid dehydrogenase